MASASFTYSNIYCDTCALDELILQIIPQVYIAQADRHHMHEGSVWFHLDHYRSVHGDVA